MVRMRCGVVMRTYVRHRSLRRYLFRTSVESNPGYIAKLVDKHIPVIPCFVCLDREFFPRLPTQAYPFAHRYHRIDHWPVL
jgi:hypothetical protein